MVRQALARPDAFAHIVNAFETPLRRYLHRVLGHGNSMVDDVLQEAFVKAYVNLNSFDVALRLGPWLYRITHNAAMDCLRRKSSERRHMSDADMGVIAECVASEAMTDDNLLAQAGFTSLQRGLSELGERYRSALILRFLEDRSYLEIADILRIPPGTVATLIRRGLIQLRRTLDEGERKAG